MKLVIVVDVDGFDDGDEPDPTLVGPEDVAGEVVDEDGWHELGRALFRVKVVRAEWEDTVRREGADALVDDEDE